MAFFKIGSATSTGAVAASPTSIESLRRRARHRLIGATVLVLLGVVAFPVLFDTQPRPIPVDIAIDIPDRNKVKPLAPAQEIGSSSAPASPASATPASAAPSPPVASPAPKGAGASGAGSPAKVPAAASLEGREQLVDAPAAAAAAAATASAAPAAPAASASAAPRERAAAAPAPSASRERSGAAVQAAAAPTSAAAARSKPSSDGERAKALLEGRTPDAAAASSSDSAGARFIVQVGAFAEADRVREVRSKLERAGLKTYVHVIDTPDGKRTRVRLGPFANRTEADAAAAKARSLDLPGSVLAL